MAQSIYDKVEHLLHYKFKNRILLIDAVQIDGFGRGDASLADIGHIALQHFDWTTFYARNAEKDVTWGLMGAFSETLQLKDYAADVEEIAILRHLWPYVEECCLLKMKGILGAVWMDSERNLEEVRDLLDRLGWFHVRAVSTYGMDQPNNRPVGDSLPFQGFRD